MDFNKLIGLAAQTQRLNDYSRNERRYSTKISAAKKIEKERKGMLSASVRAFLDKKDEEEKLKRDEEDKKKELLLQARKEARHMKKAHAMATRTKDNLKVFTDEQLDDARKEEEERLQKMKEAQERTKNYLKDIAAGRKPRPIKTETVESTTKSSSSTSSSKSESKKSSDEKTEKDKDKHKDKDRSKDKHKDREKSKDSSSKSDKHKDNKDGGKSGKKEKVKKKRPANMPPPMSFTELLAMAQKKLAGPIAPVNTEGEQEAPKKKEPKKNIPERPMTQEEKERVERRKSQAYQRYLKFGGKRPDLPNDGVERKGAPKMASPSTTSSTASRVSEDNGQRVKPRDSIESKKDVPISKPSSNQAPSGSSVKSLRPGGVVKPGSSLPSGSQTSLSKPGLSKNDIPSKAFPSKPSSSAMQKPSKNSPQDSPAAKSKNGEDRKRPLEESRKRLSEEPLSHWDRLYASVEKKKLKPAAKRPMVIDSEEEEDYDSEMDDFIDDGEEDKGYSSYIKEIFGYDKSRYANVDEDDLSDMETGFSHLEKEEAYSAKQGYLEDLEDIRKEEEEKREKMLRKKMLAKKMKKR